MPEARLVVEFLDALREVVGSIAPDLMPSALFDTFRFTRTGNNYAHPRVWGTAVKAAWDIVPTGGFVEVDTRLNDNRGHKFQPDLLLRDAKGTVLLAVDIESPNSSDARLLPKDVDAYVEWSRHNDDFPYLVVTMLPRRARSRDEWEFRWPKGYNWEHRDRAAEVCKDPFAYWYGLLVHDLPVIEKFKVYFANFDGLDLKQVSWDDVPPLDMPKPDWLDSIDAKAVDRLLSTETERELRLVGAKQVVESIATGLTGKENKAAQWPEDGATSVWCEILEETKKKWWLGLAWSLDGAVPLLTLSVWVEGAGYRWPGARGPAHATDVESLKARVSRLHTWWNS